MRQLVLSFLLGAVVGAFAALVVSPSGDAPAPADPVNAPTAGALVKDGADESITISHEATNAELALNLDRARFDRNWDRVTAVSRVLRERGEGSAASPSRPYGGSSLGRSSMVLLDHDYRRQAFLLELAGHDNEATRVAASDAPTSERERRLLDLLGAPLVKPMDGINRRDAAILLGFMRTPGARKALLRTLKDPDPDLALLGAEALGQANDKAATGALLEVLSTDLDAALRALAARALVWTRDAAAGGEVAVALARAAREDRDLGVRTHALAALARVDLDACDVGRQLLSSLIEDETEDASVRLAAVAAVRVHRKIARSLPSDLVLSLERTLELSTGQLRQEVVSTLGEAGRAETLPLLEGALLGANDPTEAHVLRDAIAALKQRAAPR